MSRPLIGITTRLDLAQNTFYLRRYYSEAVAAAGGDPVLIPLVAEEPYLHSLAARCDGLLLSGSNSDIDPKHYNEEPHLHLGCVVEERDQTDLILLRFAEEKNLSVLAICFGAQSLAVSRGGSLIQDLPSQVDNVLKHDQGEPYSRPSHTITIEVNSLLAQLAGGITARVNSSHHQAIKDPGENLRITATTQDGVIECVEDTRAERFVFGVQWHPELGWEKDELSQAIFKKFVAEAGKSKL
ncbi:MAG TPA: gamma-glutamyl-gamma-aminobutyrate hydrolase family protein [Blastocatellia bacterium]|nr:gamma-glutamyl-gamma-aminobutyrate hydrolase family protein [Blastocatellia bacterium]